MPSTVSTPVTARIPNEQLGELRRLAEILGTSTSCVIAVCVERTLEELPHHVQLYPLDAR